MFKSNFFGRIFWIEDNNDFKSCPFCVDETGDFDQEDYVTDWEDWEGVSVKELLNIHHACIINKINHANSLSLNDFAFTHAN